MGFINFPNSITERHVMCKVKTSFVFNLLMISFSFVQTIFSFTKIQRNKNVSWWICKGREASAILVEIFHGIFMFSTDVYSTIQSIYCSINWNVYGFFYFFPTQLKWRLSCSAASYLPSWLVSEWSVEVMS